MPRPYKPDNTPNPFGNRATRRAAYSQKRKLSTVAIVNGVPQQAPRKSLTGSNRSRPLLRFRHGQLTMDQYSNIIGRWMDSRLAIRKGA